MLCSAINFYQSFENSLLTIYEFTWIKQGSLNIPFSFISTIYLIISYNDKFITFLVIIYSQEYLSTDKYLIRFIITYVFFVSYAFTVVSGNYLCLFIYGN